jgi:ATP-binding cassette subfamily F protein 3
MFSVKNLSKSYGVETLFSGVNFNVNPGERLALIGPNGSGKSTLMRILAGVEKPDSGSVSFNSPARAVGYLPQGSFATTLDEAGAPPAESLTLAQFLFPGGLDTTALEAELERLAVDFSRQPEREDLQSAYDKALARLTEAAETANRLPPLLAALGLDGVPAGFPVASLSGGQQTRLALARILLQQPQVLLLDEPTNHLDLEMLAWLEKWLISSPCAVLFVSHDRRFLEKVATGILEVDPREKAVRLHAVSYGEYLQIKAGENEEMVRVYSDQQEQIARLKSAARHMRDTATFTKGGKADTNDKFAKAFFANRSIRTVGRAKAIERKIDKILDENPAERPAREWGLKIDFEEAGSRARDVLTFRDLAVGYGDNVLLHDINLVLGYGSRAALIGSNGSGKSSLMKTVTGEIQPLAGEVRLGAGVKLGVLNQVSGSLTGDGNPLTEIQSVSGYNETEARAFLSYYLFRGDAVFTPLSALSYGEQSRLALAKLVAGQCNLLLLDEPTNHLDIPSREQIEQAVLAFPGTVLFVVHDRAFIDRVATEVWEIRERRVEKVG